MPLDLERISVGYTYTRDQAIAKMTKSPILSKSIAQVNKNLNDIETVINRQITEIYQAAYRSTVPIKSAKTKGGSSKLTSSQKQRVRQMLASGKSAEQIVKAITSSPGNAYGGTLRNKHIDSNINKIKKGVTGLVWVDDEPHITPYNTNKRDSETPASTVARDLNIGVSHRQKLTQVGSAGKYNSNIYTSGKGKNARSYRLGVYNNVATHWRRSRDSDAEPGFQAIGKGRPTAFWIEDARKQAAPIIQAYLNAGGLIGPTPKTLAAFTDSDFASINDITANRIKKYVSREGVPTYREQQQQLAKELRGPILGYIGKNNLMRGNRAIAVQTIELADRELFKPKNYLQRVDIYLDAQGKEFSRRENYNLDDLFGK